MGSLGIMYLLAIAVRRAEPDSRGSTPLQDHGDKDYRIVQADTTAPPLPTVSSSITVVQPQQDTDQREWQGGGPQNRPGGYQGDRGRGRPQPPGPPRRPRCRDYDEKGFCMRGDLCPFDHGNDPVVVEDVNLPNMLAFPGNTNQFFS